MAVPSKWYQSGTISGDLISNRDLVNSESIEPFSQSQFKADFDEIARRLCENVKKVVHDALSPVRSELRMLRESLAEEEQASLEEQSATTEISPPPSSSTSSSSSVLNNNGRFFSNTSYNDDFGDPPKFTSSSSLAEDYTEIFGVFRSSSSRSPSSIPVLGPPAVSADIHGVFNAVDVAVPFDEPSRPCDGSFCDGDADGDGDGTSDEAWTPVGVRAGGGQGEHAGGGDFLGSKVSCDLLQKNPEAIDCGGSHKGTLVGEKKREISEEASGRSLMGVVSGLEKKDPFVGNIAGQLSFPTFYKSPIVMSKGYYNTI